MNINSLSTISNASSVSNARPKTAAAAADGASAPSPAARPQISGPGQAFAKLSELAEKDPEKFKALASKISEQLKEAAGKAEGGAAEQVNKLAEKFAAAAQSGDMSEFKGGPAGGPPPGSAPPGGPPPGGGHAGRAQHAQRAGGGQGDSIRQILDNALSEVNDALGASTSATSNESSSVSA